MAIGVISSQAGAAGGDAGTVQTGDAVSNFSFDNLHTEALKIAEGNTQTEQSEQVASPDASQSQQVEQTEQTTDDVTNADTASAQKLAQLGDDDLVEIQVDGQPQVMPWKEAKGYTMRQAKFTKEMQGLAQQRKDLENQQATLSSLNEERDALVTLLKDEGLLREFIGKRYPALLKAQAQVEQAALSTDPGDIATVEQIQSARQEFAETVNGLVDSLQKELGRRDEALVQRIQDAQTVVKLQGEIRTTVDSLFEAHPYIKSLIPNAEDMLRYEVARLDPRTPQATIEAFKQVFEGWVDNYKTTVAQTNKKQVIERHKLNTNNPKPAKGAAQVQPEPTKFTTKNRAGKTDVDWNAVHKTALDILNQHK
jgi:hypothetical protein